MHDLLRAIRACWCKCPCCLRSRVSVTVEDGRSMGFGPEFSSCTCAHRPEETRCPCAYCAAVVKAHAQASRPFRLSRV